MCATAAAGLQGDPGPVQTRPGHSRPRTASEVDGDGAVLGGDGQVGLVPVEPLEDVVRGAEDPGRGGPQGGLEVVLSGHPAADVREGVAGGVQAAGGGDEEGDRLGFDLDPAPAVGLVQVCDRDLVGAVQQHVAELVGQGLGLLRRVEVRVDLDLSGEVVGAAAGAAAGVVHREGEPRLVDLAG